QDAVENPPTGRPTPGKTIVQNPCLCLHDRFRKLLSHGPDEPRQFSGTSDDRGLRGLPALHQAPVLPAKSFFSPMRYMNDRYGTSPASFRHRLTMRVRPPVMPRRFNQDSADMAVSHLCDAAAKDSLSGRMLGADKACKSHKASSLLKSLEILHLRDQRQG